MRIYLTIEEKVSHANWYAHNIIDLLWVWLKLSKSAWHLSLMTWRPVTRLEALELSPRTDWQSNLGSVCIICCCPFAVRFFIVSGGVFVWLQSIEYWHCVGCKCSLSVIPSLNSSNHHTKKNASEFWSWLKLDSLLYYIATRNGRCYLILLLQWNKYY